MHVVEITFELSHCKNCSKVEVRIMSAGTGFELYRDSKLFQERNRSLPEKFLSEKPEVTRHCGFIKSDNSIWIFCKDQGLEPQLVPFEGVVTDLEDDVHYYWHSHAKTV